MKNLSFIWRAPSKEDKGACCCFVDALSDTTPHILFFLFIWLLTPPLFVYLATQLLNSSFLAPRYMILSYIPLFLIAGWGVSALKNKIAKYFFICLIVIFYFANTLIPNFVNDSRFSRRIPHDWRGALAHVETNFKKGDSIILRSGFIKENWIPETENKIIHEYVKAPLRSFYFNDIDSEKIYNLTFSPSREFQPYYDKIFANLAQAERIWIIGVSKPNGFPISNDGVPRMNIPELLKNTHKIIFTKNYSGVYVALLVQ